MKPPTKTSLAQALATLAQAPDPTAWALVLEQNGAAMEQLARRLTGDSELARDAVQEALLQIRDCAGSFRAPSAGADRAAHYWILRVTANTALSLLRRQARQKRREQIIMTHHTNESPAVDSGLVATELAERVRAELAALPEPTRAAIVLHHCAGLTFSAVATALGVPEGTAKIRVHRGVTLLRSRLRRAGFASSLLTISGLFQHLSASETSALFTTSSAAQHLLTTSKSSSITFMQQGFSMTTLTAIASATAVLLIGSVSLLLSQDPPATVPHVPITPAPVTTVPSVSTEIKPIAITADQTALIKLADSINGEVEFTWNDRLRQTSDARRGFAINLWELKQGLLTQPSLVPAKSNWQTTLDTLAKELGQVWRMRGSEAEFMPPALAKKLTTKLNGHQAPRGTRSDIIAWFSRKTGFSFKIHDSLGIDDGQQFTWSKQTATSEAWLDGLAAALHATALLSHDGEVLLYKRPTVAPLENDPEFIATAPQLVYQAPPKARLDKLITWDLQDLQFNITVHMLAQALGFPVKIAPDILKSDTIFCTLRVQDMEIRYVAQWICSINKLELQILPDHILFSRKVNDTNSSPKDDEFGDLGRVTGVRTAADPEGTAAWAATIRIPKKRLYVTECIAEIWTRINTEKAVGWAVNIADYDTRICAVSAVAKWWACQEPEAAAAWAVTLKDKMVRCAAIKNIANSWEKVCNGDRYKYAERLKRGEIASPAATWAGALTGDEESMCAVGEVISIWAVHHLENEQAWLENARAWALSLKVNGARNIALCVIAENLARTDPVQAAAMVKSLDDCLALRSALSDIAMYYVRKDREKAVSWFFTLPAGETREGALKLLSQLGNCISSPKETAWVTDEIIKKLDVGKEQTVAVQKIVSQWSYKDPEKTAEWAAVLEDHNLKVAAYKEIAKVWFKTDPKKATAWVQSLDPAMQNIIKISMENSPLDSQPKPKVQNANDF